jgi:hypothetical protein
MASHGELAGREGEGGEEAGARLGGWGTMVRGCCGGARWLLLCLLFVLNVLYMRRTEHEEEEKEEREKKKGRKRKNMENFPNLNFSKK